MTNIIQTEKFAKHLDAWLMSNKPIDGKYLSSAKNSVPQLFRNYTQTLYRGMTVDGDFLEKANTTGVTFKSQTSWSKEKKIAIGFVKDDRFRVSNKSGTQILISKKIPQAKQVLDVHSFVSFMGAYQLETLGYDEMNIDSAMKEFEVIVDKGIKITMKDIEFL